MTNAPVTEPSSDPDFVLPVEDIAYAPFDLPGFTGPTQAAFANTDVSRAPFIALLKMEPGAVLKKHYHPTIPEAVYVVEGEMINDGAPLKAGSFLIHGPGILHGPHTTRTGCILMFIQSSPVDPNDSVFFD